MSCIGDDRVKVSSKEHLGATGDADSVPASPESNLYTFAKFLFVTNTKYNVIGNADSVQVQRVT